MTNITSKEDRKTAEVASPAQWIVNCLWFAGMMPFVIVGYVAHKIFKFVFAGLLIGWITSRDFDK